MRSEGKTAVICSHVIRGLFQAGGTVFCFSQPASDRLSEREDSRERQITDVIRAPGVLNPTNIKNDPNCS